MQNPLARCLEKTLTKAIERAQEEIRVEEMFIGKGQQLDRRNKVVEARARVAAPQPKIRQPRFEKGRNRPPKKK